MDQSAAPGCEVWLSGSSEDSVLGPSYRSVKTSTSFRTGNEDKMVVRCNVIV